MCTYVTTYINILCTLTYMYMNLCIMDSLRPLISVLDQVSCFSRSVYITC